MDIEIMEKLEKIEKELTKTRKQILTELAVYNNKFDSNINTLVLQNRLLKSRIEKYFDYENYFDKFKNLDNLEDFS